MVELVGRVVLGGRSVRAARPSRGGLSRFDAEGARLVAVGLGGAPQADPGQLAGELERFVLGADAILPPLAAEVIDGDLVVGYAARGAETLDQTIARGATPPPRVADIADGVAQALGFLHDRGLAHGFLRPDLVSTDVGRIALEGYGLDRLILGCAGREALLSALGDPYAAPELAASSAREGRPAADVRALGVIIVELLAGRPVASDEAPREALAALGLAEPARTLLAAALAPEPSRRPMDVVRFATELGDALRSAPAPKPQPPRTPQPPPAPQPQPDPPPDPPPQPQPPPQPPEPPRMDSEPRTLWPLLSILAGVVLLLTGVVVLFAYAWMRPASSSSSTVVAVAPDAGVPPVVVAPPDAAVAPPPVADAAPPEEDDDGDAGVAFAPDDAGPPIALGGSADSVDALIPIRRDEPVLGKADALVTIVVFGDLECPHTQREIKDLERLRKAFGAELRIAWRHRPLRDHTHARDAALVAESIYAERGAAVFWRLLQTIASDAAAPTRSNLERWVTAAGGDGARVSAWLSSSKAKKAVDEDLELAGLFDVRSTPTFFVNGARIEGYQPYRTLEDAVRRELGAARTVMSGGVPRSDLYATRVRKNLVDLGTDVPDRNCPAIGDAPVRGKADALVTIVEFSDFQCPFCRRLQPALEQVLARHGGDVRLVWKNFPLGFHRDARPAAALALQAYEVGGATRFWRAHDLLFAGQRDLGEASLSRIASDLGLDPATTLGAVRRGKFEARIDADVREGKRVGVNGTPVLYINGRMLPGARPASELDSVVREEIDWARKLVAQGTVRSKVYETLCGKSP